MFEQRALLLLLFRAIVTISNGLHVDGRLGRFRPLFRSACVVYTGRSRFIVTASSSYSFQIKRTPLQYGDGEYNNYRLVKIRARTNNTAGTIRTRTRLIALCVSRAIGKMKNRFRFYARAFFTTASSSPPPSFTRERRHRLTRFSADKRRPRFHVFRP